MNAISHEYPKLHGQTSAELLAVRPLKVDAYTPAMLERKMHEREIVEENRGEVFG